MQREQDGRCSEETPHAWVKHPIHDNLPIHIIFLSAYNFALVPSLNVTAALLKAGFPVSLTFAATLSVSFLLSDLK
jgi:hypothetical protein